MPTEILPIINANPDVNYNQDLLIERLVMYFSEQDPHQDLPFNSELGLCSGLVSYWLYSKRVGEEGNFIYKLEHVLKNNDPQDKITAEFVNNIMLLQADYALRYNENITQDNLTSSFKLLLSEYHDPVNKPEFNFTFVFDKAALSQFIGDYVFSNKMVRFDNGFHTMGLMYSGDIYYLYDPNSELGPRSFTSRDDLVDSIFNGLGKYCGSKDYIAIYTVIFDIDNKKPAPYKDLECKEYYQKLLDDQQYKNAVLTHKNIFHLGMRYADNNYYMLDKLFDIGYEYIPWTLNNSTEYEDAVVRQDQRKLDYLLKRNIPINYRAPDGTTPLARATIGGFNKIVYNLLLAGADPNAEAADNTSLLEIAILFKNVSAIILLIAAGMRLSKSDKKWLAREYTKDGLEAIIMNALSLHVIFNPTQKKPVRLELLQSMDEIVLAITSKELKLRSDSELEHIKIILHTLESLATCNDSNIRSSAESSVDKLSNYLHIKKAPGLIFRAALSYEEDIEPLLSIKLKIKS